MPWLDDIMSLKAFSRRREIAFSSIPRSFMPTPVLCAVAADGPAYWDLVPAALGAILGAAAAAFPSFWLAKRASSEVLVRDREARREREITASSRVFVKLSMIANDILGAHRQVEDMIARADRDGRSDMKLWERLSVFKGVDAQHRIGFDADDLALFVAAKEIAFMDDLLLLARQRDTMNAGLEEYGRVRIELHDLIASLGITVRADDGVSSTHIRMPADQANRLRVRMEEMELYATALREQLQGFAAHAEKTANAYGPVVHRYFGDTSLPTLSREPSS